eukprot:scaffold4677_cov125-Skeletonema_marinoi.AAC.1
MAVILIGQNESRHGGEPLALVKIEDGKNFRSILSDRVLICLGKYRRVAILVTEELICIYGIGRSSHVRKPHKLLSKRVALSKQTTKSKAGICEGEEDELAVLIYKSSKTAKARAAAAAAAKKERMHVASASVGRRTSTRKRSASSSNGSAFAEKAAKKDDKKKDYFVKRR